MLQMWTYRGGDAEIFGQAAFPMPELQRKTSEAHVSEHIPPKRLRLVRYRLRQQIQPRLLRYQGDLQKRNKNGESNRFIERLGQRGSVRFSDSWPDMNR